MLALVVTTAVGVAPVRAQDSSPPQAVDPGGAENRRGPLPADFDFTFSNARTTADGTWVMTGSVTITGGEGRIQADSITLTEQRYVEAEGNVLIVWGGNRIFGTRMSYDLETETGIIEQAIGNVEAEFIFWAKQVEKIGPNKLRLLSANVTTCTQPVPYWSFAVSRATVTIDNYVRMTNMRLRAGKAPIFYLPYLVWPVKKERAAGLLLPEFQSNEERGFAYTQEVFVPLGRSADITLLGRYYTKAGFGYGGEARWVPNRRGAASLAGFAIRDKVAEDMFRYSVTYNQTQEFVNGFRMVADINLVSDFNYFSDYERDLTRASSPTILGRLEFTRNGRWASMNVRELRREQLLSSCKLPDGTVVTGDDCSLVQWALPEIEWRGRSLRLGRSPFFLGYEASVASIRQEGFQSGAPIDADYLRGDAFPQISVPLSPVPWLDITPQVSYRATYWTQRQEFFDIGGSPLRVIEDDSISRGLFGAGVDIVGPKIVRIFEPEDPTRAKYKHSIEPRLSYGYQEEYDELANVIVYDEVDQIAGAGNAMSYAIVQRLFTRRPRSEAEPAPDLLETIMLPDGTASEAPRRNPVNAGPDASPAIDESAPPEPLEVASLELRQSRSFDRDLTFADLDGDGVTDHTSPYSSIQAIGRYNPNSNTTLDLRTSYHILYKTVSDATLSGGVRNRLAAIKGSLVFRNGLGVRNVGTIEFPDFEPVQDDTQLRLTAGLNLLQGKLRLSANGSVIFDPDPGERSIPDRRWRVEYSNQCCTFLLERVNRQFQSLADRSDYYFRVDLRGIGKLVDVKY
jgi:LPS-assembly protein